MNILSNNFAKPFVISLLSLSILAACGGSSNNTPAPTPTPAPAPTDPEEAIFSVALFSEDSANVTNRYFPLKPGVSMVYEGLNDEGELERVEIGISHETRMVDGVLSRIVVDRAYVDGELEEETFDWYAQDMDGNVWYMGEDSVEIEDGEVISSAGSWESGLDIDGVGSIATAGVLMKAEPFTVGDTYQQEFYPGVAEDMAEILALDVSVDLDLVTLADGSQASNFITLQTLEWVPLDPDPAASEEHKYFAPGIGLVLETDTAGAQRVELKQIMDDTMPNLSPEDFSSPTLINNKFFPLVPGTTYRFITSEGEDEELILYEVLDETRDVMGISTRVVRDRVYIDGDEFSGILVEDTRDWFAQDDEGNVWYMGEEVDNYDDNGVFSDNDGSWEAGVDGAQPGIQMKQNPLKGDSYHQEYLLGEAEDIAAIVSTNASTSLENGTAYTSLKVKEWNPLEEGSTEYKYYAAGVGFIREEKLDEAGEVEEAIELNSVEIAQSFENFALQAVYNEAEDEAQVIIAGSAEPDFFKTLQCYAPNGLSIVNAEVDEDSGNYADFQYDTAKTELDELALAYPTGTYWCIATTPDDGLLLGSASLDYEFSASIVPNFPINGSEDVAITGLSLTWTLVEDAAVIVVDIENSLTGDSLEVDLPGDSTSFSVPDDLLAEGSEYEVGFETIHASGNTTVFEDYSFTTAGVPPLDEEPDEENFGDFESLELFVVYNATDDDAQIFVEAEALDDTIMLELSISDPNGNIIHQVAFEDGEELGITDVLYESSEPAISELEEQFPGGEYTYTATFIDDDEEEFEGTGSIALAYEVLVAPSITFPGEDEEGISAFEPLTITWTGIPAAAETLVLEVEADETGETYSVELATDASSFTLPANWMVPATVYVIDLEVEHENGNVTVVDTEFETQE